MGREKSEIGDINGFKRPVCFQTDRKWMLPSGSGSQKQR